MTHGWLDGIRHVPSPNVDERPVEQDISLIVIHAISLPPGVFGSDFIERLFTNSLDADAHPYFAEIHSLRVSAHFLIRRDGEIIQFVSCDQRAWHAGVSCWRGRPRCNDFSIGIELEGSDHQAFTEAQYLALTSAIAAIYDAYPQTRRHLTGHSDIAPGRKTDPGEHFEWDKLRGLLGQRLVNT